MSKNRFFKSNKKVTLTTLGVGVAVILVGILLKNVFGFDISQVSGDSFLGKLYMLGSDNGLTLYLSQLSFTFITISVMSVLSDASVVIYWENIVKKKLIEPVWSCFHAYTTYSFGTVIFGGIAALAGLPLIFILFFVTDIIVLMALTFSMIDVYFRHDEKARKLEDEFKKLVLTQEAPMDVLKNNYEKYLKITSKLRTNTILALKNYDSPTAEENFKFYARNAAYIPQRDFEAIMKCVDEINISDYTELFDYYAHISFKDGKIPEIQAQMFINEIMCKWKDLFYFVFDPHILPLFAKASDSVSSEGLFWDYKAYMKKQRDILKKNMGEKYDRKRNSPASSYNRNMLLRGLLEVLKAGDDDFLMAFLHSFEETNMLTNYDYDESDEYLWEDYFKSVPEEEARERLNKIYPITEILYGTEYPQCVEEAVEFAWGNFNDYVGRFQKDSSSFSKFSPEEYGGGEDLRDVDFTEEYEDDLEADNCFEYADEEQNEIDNAADTCSKCDEEDDEAAYEEGQTYDGTNEDEYEDEDTYDDDMEYYCKLYGQKYMGWPPENDNYGMFTYAGREAYCMSEEHGRLNDGDLVDKVY